MRVSRGWWAAALVVMCASGCSRSKQEPTKAEDAPPRPAVVSAAGPGLTSDLEELVRLSKSGLSPEQKRGRLKAVLEAFPAEHSKEREDLIVGAVTRGAHDPPKWTTIVSNFKGRRAEIQVSTDALTILGVRVDVTAEGAQRIADALGTVLPTPRILQLIWEQATLRLEPCTSVADAKMASTARMIEHSECVDQRIAGRSGLVANEGKHWVLSNRIADKPNLAANYGWFIKGRRPVQTVGTRHDTAHTDYSQIVRLVKPMIRVDGREVDLRAAGRSPELWGLVSDEGPLLVWRASSAGSAPSPEPSVAAAAPPTPGDPASVRVSLKLEGMPVTAEQLPATTTGLRRSTLARRALSSLSMRTEDVPEVAYWSVGAAACGGRDVFFELMNDVPVDLAELADSKDALARALACGKSLVAQVRAGASVLEVDYAFEGVPSAFAMLAMPDDSFRDRLLFPPLSPAPAGVHRAYCNDDEGGPRSVCQDGARSRLLLAVDHGYLAVYAPEAPSLIERLARSEPPAPQVAELVAAFARPTDADEVAFALGGTCGFAVDFAVVDLSPDETSRQRVLDAINDHAVLCGSQWSGSPLKPSRRLVFIAKETAGAQVISAALKQRALEVRFEPSAALHQESALKQFNDAIRSMAVRASQDARVELDGRHVSLTLKLEPTGAELAQMAPRLDALAARAQAAAKVVLGLAEGRLPTPGELEAFHSAGVPGE